MNKPGDFISFFYVVDGFLVSSHVAMTANAFGLNLVMAIYLHIILWQNYKITLIFHQKLTKKYNSATFFLYNHCFWER